MPTTKTNSSTGVIGDLLTGSLPASKQVRAYDKTIPDGYTAVYGRNLTFTGASSLILLGSAQVVGVG